MILYQLSCLLTGFLPPPSFIEKKPNPIPPFQERFVGTSLTEDLALSLEVGKSWGLVNARKAEMRHDSHPRDRKTDKVAHAKMELLNRHYVMTQILERKLPSDYLRLLVCNLFEIAGSKFTSEANPVLRLWGNLTDWWDIAQDRGTIS